MDLTKIEEEERQLILMALANMAVLRPGFDDALERIAAKLHGSELFDMFRHLALSQAWEPRADTE